MILCDTGPLLAIIDKRDPDHRRCAEAFRGLTDRDLITTWPCITEAMYLMGMRGGWRFQQRLWSLWESKWLTVHTLTGPFEPRLRGLMQKYRDRPMDFADASLVVLAKDLVPSMSRAFCSDCSKLA